MAQSRSEKISFFLIKVLYFYGKAFGIVHFTVHRTTNRPKLIHSVKIRFATMGFRFVSLIAYGAFTAESLKKAIHVSSPVFTIVLTAFDVARQKDFVELLNRTIDVFLRISKLTNHPAIFTAEFYAMILTRFSFITYASLLNVGLAYRGFTSGDYLLIVEWVVEHYLWIGAYVVLDTCFVGYVTLAALYKNISDFIIGFESRLGKATKRTSLRAQLFRDSSLQLDECRAIYLDIFKITNDFHGLFQFSILYILYIDVYSIVVLAHYSFWKYLVQGEIIFRVLVVVVIRTSEVLLLTFAAETVIQRSRIVRHLNWDSTGLDIYRRWNRAVDQLLILLRFQDLRIEIYGLFNLNNEFGLRVISGIVAYLTILFQFGMMGNYQDQNYVFGAN